MLRVDGTKIVRALFPLLKEFSWRLFPRYNPLGNLNSQKATSSRLYRILCSIRCAEKKSYRLTLSEWIFTLGPYFTSHIAWCAWKSLWKIFFLQILFVTNCFIRFSFSRSFSWYAFQWVWVRFLSKKLLFRILYRAYIVALFLGQNFIIFQKFVHQWIARIFLYRFIYFSKKITKNFRKKILKIFCVLIILARKKVMIFFENLLLYCLFGIWTSI